MERLLLSLALVAAASAPALADATANVESALVGFTKLTSYHVSITSPQNKSVQGDVVNPGRLHVSVAPVELIMIDGTSYFKMNGTWKKFTIPGLATFASPIGFAKRLAEHRQSIVAADLGMKTVDDMALHAYSVHQRSGDRAIIVYLDQSGDVARIDTSGDGGAIVIRFSRFNTPISIEAPPGV